MAIIVPIGVDTSGLTRGITQAQSGLRKFGRIAAIAAGAAAMGAVVKTLQVGTAEFMEQQKVAAQTGAVLKSTGGIANVTAKQIGSLSTALMKKSGVDDEAIASGQNLLLTFTKIRNETGKGNDIFDQATVAMLDLSVAMGKDLNSSAILVGKALNDPVKGATALSRAGVQLTKGQKDQIEAFVESGRVLDAQKIILGELTTQFGGSAEAAGKTLPGQLNILKQTFNNLAGELAATFLPGLATAATKLVEFLNRFTGAPTLKAKAEIIVGGIVDAAGNAYRNLITWWTTTQRTELPARVIITPSGRQQFDAFFTDLERRAREAGGRAGRRFATFLIDSFSSEGRARSGRAIQDVANKIGEIGQFWFRVTGTTLLNSFVTGFTSEFVPRLFNALKGALDEVGKLLLTPARVLGEKARAAFDDGAEKESRKNKFKTRLSKNVLEAIQAARQSLASGGAALSGTLATILGATFTRPGGSTPAAILTEERRIEDKRFEIEEARLKEAAEATEATEEDKLALAEFYLNKEKTLRDRALEDEITNRQRSIDSLIEEFNKGLKSATQFETELRGIIGADFGTELGTAFAAAFEREIGTVIATAKDIAGVAGAPALAVPTGGPVSDVRMTEYRERLKKWQDGLDNIVDRLEKQFQKEDSDGGKKLTVAEKNAITAAIIRYKNNNPKPQRPTGLALGGILKQPTFVAGEAGKEAVIPLESGSAMRILRDAIGGGGGSTQNIYLTVHAGLGTNPDELSQVIVNSIKRYEKRNGAVFQGPLVTTAANATGRTDTATGATTFNKIRTLRSG